MLVPAPIPCRPGVWGDESSDNATALVWTVEDLLAPERCEELIRAAGLNATFLRPWYVLGPGHRWPYLLKPLYAIGELLPSTRDGARRLGLVTLPQIVGALVQAVENAPAGVRVIDVPEIRSLGKSAI